MRLLVAGLFLACLAPGMAAAGAWARGDGNAFLSATQTRTVWPSLADSGADMASFYGEYGLGERLTLGTKYDRREDGYGSFEGFARWHLQPVDARWQGAVETGLGRLIAPGAPSDPVFSLAGLAGAGFEWRARNGWAEAELRQTRRLSDGTGWRNLDLTIGLAVTERVSGLVQARLYDDAGADRGAFRSAAACLGAVRHHHQDWPRSRRPTPAQERCHRSRRLDRVLTGISDVR